MRQFPRDLTPFALAPDTLAELLKHAAPRAS
jgi:hypothetical protein